jgi:predicted nucleotidyltransferase
MAKAREQNTVAELLQGKRDEILQVAVRHGARNVRIFGSAARGEATEQSDVDFLVDMEPGRSFFDLAELLEELRRLLGRDVDVVTESSLYWLLRRRILKEAKPL